MFCHQPIETIHLSVLAQRRYSGNRLGGFCIYKKLTKMRFEHNVTNCVIAEANVPKRDNNKTLIFKDKLTSFWKRSASIWS